MAAGTPLSAKNAKVRINGAVLFNTKWTATPESAMLDTSNIGLMGLMIPAASPPQTT